MSFLMRIVAVASPLLILFTSTQIALAEDGIKFGMNVHQYVPFEGNAFPKGASLFIGEHLDKFGDIGFYGLVVFPSNGLTHMFSAGVNFAPSFFQENWGALYWNNKIGFGAYESNTQLNLNTGLRLEPGSYFTIALDILSSIPIGDGNTSKYPLSLGIGLGFRFQ